MIQNVFLHFLQLYITLIIKACLSKNSFFLIFRSIIYKQTLENKLFRHKKFSLWRGFANAKKT
jgi:hypothetical protein